jgi:auxin efflux carrier family protein
MLLGFAFTKFFKFPSWVTAALAFNNTTSMPLLLVQSLDSTGILKSILMGESDSSSAAVDRAKSYFLVNAMVSNSLTFALGPRMLNGQEEDAPEQERKEENEDANGNDVERGNDDHEASEEEEIEQNERTTLLPSSAVRSGHQILFKASSRVHSWTERLPKWARETLDILQSFINAPVIGTLIGAIIGLVPVLHKAFFADTFSGGIFNAWLTSSIKNIGDLFASLQIIVVGVKLASAMRKTKNSEGDEETGSVPWIALIFVTLVRFIIWPVISISIVYGLAKRTGVLDDDPVLWFAMMLMPVGPPAMKLMALAEVNGSNEAEKMSVAKFLTVSACAFGKTTLCHSKANRRQISYLISPLICFSVVGSLKASEAVIG